MIFNSPETGSSFHVIMEYGQYILCYRKVDNDRYRVRIQINNGGSQVSIKGKLKFAAYWSYKNSHFSIVTDYFHLRYAVTDAFQAIFAVVPIYDTKVDDVK